QGDDLATADLERMLGVSNPDGDSDQGYSHSARAIQLGEKIYGPLSSRVLLDRGNLATTLDGMGRYDEAHAQYQRVIALTEQLFGTDAGQLELPLTNQSWDLTFMG